jgi:5-oxoprolinase (ATP-hydrolysing)
VSIISGPAGGVVGYSKTSTTFQDNNNNKIIPFVGFDMGGTSTDVSRVEGMSFTC